MSHYTVIVVGPKPEELLAPYREGDTLFESEGGRALWDWYSLGGRWTGYFKAKAGVLGETGVFNDQAESGHFDRILKADLIGEVETPYGLLTADGKYHSRGDMGWFGMSSNEKDDWPDRFKKLWAAIPDDETVSLYDLHI